MVGASILGALAMSSEYSSRLIRTTFLAVPDRRRVVLAKAVVLVVVTSLLGMVTAIASFVTAQAILSGEQLGISISRPAVASTAILPVCAVIGIAVGTLIRTPVATLFTAVLFPVLLGKAPSSSNQLTAALSNSAPQSGENGGHETPVDAQGRAGGRRRPVRRDVGDQTGHFLRTDKAPQQGC